MAGLVPAMHVSLSSAEDVDARHKAGHDAGGAGVEALRHGLWAFREIRHLRV